MKLAGAAAIDCGQIAACHQHHACLFRLCRENPIPIGRWGSHAELVSAVFIEFYQVTQPEFLGAGMTPIEVLSHA
jgi:hypothetical protein